MALNHYFGESIEMHLFEKDDKAQWEVRDIEISIGVPLQLSLYYLGIDIKELKKQGYSFSSDPSVRQGDGKVIQRAEQAMRGYHTGYISQDADGLIFQLFEFSVRRSVFKDFLSRELEKRVGTSLIRWSACLTKINFIEDHQVNLEFADGQVCEGFDLVIGADGVYSKVREESRIKIKPQHVGVNIFFCYYSWDNRFVYAGSMQHYSK